MNLTEYEHLLKKHDWAFEMSDDHSAWKRGKSERTMIEQLAVLFPERKALLEAYRQKRDPSVVMP